MKLQEKYKVGENLFILTSRFREGKRHYTITPSKITAVGRKYISCGYSRYTECYEDGIYMVAYSSGYGTDSSEKAFSSEQDAKDYIEADELISSIYDEMNNVRARFEHGKITLDMLRTIESSMRGEKIS